MARACRVDPVVRGMIELRPYQRDLLNAARAAYAHHRRVLLQLSTGGGKTAIASAVVAGAVAKRRRVLYVTHRDEIHGQTHEALGRVGVTAAHLKAGGHVGSIEPGAILLASAHTLARRDVPEHDLLIWDEAHVQHAAQLRVQAAHPQARVLCLAATPARLDGKPLADIADTIVSGPSMAWLVEAGYLTPCRVYAAPSPDMHGVAIKGGEFAPGEAEKRHRAPSIVGSIPDQWRKHAAGRRTILFASGVDHSLEVCAALCAAGIRAVHVDGTSADSVRREAFNDLAAHRVDVVCNVGLAIEGLDLPAIECVYWARSTASLPVYLQGTGRGMRPSPGKSDTVVIDGGGNVWRHGLPDEARVWSLTGKPRRASGPGLATCGECLAIWDGVGPCPRCGSTGSPGTERQPPRGADGELIVITAADLARMRSQAVKPLPAPLWVENIGLWNTLERKRAANGYDLGDGSRAHPGYTVAMYRRLNRG